MRQIFANLASTKVASAVGISDTTIAVDDASVLPTPGADEYWTGVLYKLTGGIESSHEIVHVTGISANTLTVTRAAEPLADGTQDGQAFAAGDYIDLRDTAGTLERLQTTETVATATTSIDRADGGIQTLTLTAASTLSVAIDEGQSITLHLYGGATHAVTWPTMTWVGGSPPTLTAADVIALWKVGSILYGANVGSIA